MRPALAWALTRLAQIERDLDNLDAALQHHEEAVVLYREDGNVLRLAHSVRHVGVPDGIAEGSERLARLAQRR